MNLKIKLKLILIKVDILSEENKKLLEQNKELQCYKDDAKRIINNLNEINKELKNKQQTKKKNTKKFQYI